MNPLADIEYITLRLIRRQLTQRVCLILNKLSIIKPGLGTTNPEGLLQLYAGILNELGLSFQGKTVMELGFGGNLAIGLWYHLYGAKRIHLLDPCAQLRKELSFKHCQEAISIHPEYDFGVKLDTDGNCHPDCDIYKIEFKGLTESNAPDNSLDFICSCSVMEHVNDMTGLAGACRAKLAPCGYFVASVDLSDHYSKYPFQMYKYSERTWKRYLNPPSNLNRFRTPDYERCCAGAGLKLIKKEIVNRDMQGLSGVWPKLAKEFKAYSAEEMSIRAVVYVYQKPV